MRGLKTNQNELSDAGKGAATTETAIVKKSHACTKQHIQPTATLRDIKQPCHSHNSCHFSIALNIKKNHLLVLTPKSLFGNIYPIAKNRDKAFQD
jgi:hypothetical protein